MEKLLNSSELQKQRGVESSACAIESQQHVIATILEAQYDIPDSNFASRYNFIFSNPSEDGTNPLVVADSFRKDGLIPDGMMPFDETIKNWQDFVSWKGVNEKLCRIAGKNWRLMWEPKYDIVFQRYENTEIKYKKLREALKYSPIVLSVRAWTSKDGIYVKPPGLKDQHLVECVYLDEENRPWIRDTYEPYSKILEPYYESDFAMRYTLVKIDRPEKEKQQLNFIDKLIELLGKLFKSGVKENDQISPKSTLNSPQIDLKQPLDESNSEKLYKVAIASVGKDVTPNDEIIDDVACVTNVCYFLRQVVADLPNLAYTPYFLDYLKKDNRFELTNEVSPGHIILSATGTGNGTIRGHTGIISKNEKIMSGNSTTGRWEENFTLSSWDKRYRVGGGMKTWIFRIKN